MFRFPMSQGNTKSNTFQDGGVEVFKKYPGFIFC